MHISSRAATVVLLIAASSAACDVRVNGQDRGLDIIGAHASDVWRRSYTLRPSGRLEIVNVNGGIEVERSDGAQIQVFARRTARASSDREARALLDATRMAEEVSDDRVRVEAMPPRQDGNWFVIGSSGVQVEYLIQVPANLRLSLETRNGGIRLSNVSGVIEAVTRNGGIRGQRLSGSLNARAVNGGIRVEMDAVTGDIDLSLRNGGIRLELPRDTKASLDARCVNGGISVDDDFALQTSENSREHSRLRDERRRFAGMINGGGARITASTVNGGIRIRSGPPQRS